MRGLYDPQPLALREADVITDALGWEDSALGRSVVKVPFDEPYTVPHDGWYVIEFEQ